MLHPREEELQDPMVSEFMGIDEYRYYVEDGEVSENIGRSVNSASFIVVHRQRM